MSLKSWYKYTRNYEVHDKAFRRWSRNAAQVVYIGYCLNYKLTYFHTDLGVSDIK